MAEQDRLTAEEILDWLRETKDYKIMVRLVAGGYRNMIYDSDYESLKAQLAQSQEVCPSCGGEELVKRAGVIASKDYEWEEFCPTCQGTDKAKRTPLAQIMGAMPEAQELMEITSMKQLIARINSYKWGMGRAVTMKDGTIVIKKEDWAEIMALCQSKGKAKSKPDREKESSDIIRCIKDAQRVHPGWGIDDIIELLEFREETRQAVKKRKLTKSSLMPKQSRENK